MGGHVKLPGPSAKEPNVYDFGTPYQKILDDLKSKDEALYTRNGLIQVGAGVLGERGAVAVGESYAWGALHV